MFPCKLKILTTLVTFLLFFIYCEKYTGYKLDAEPLDNITKVRGVIRNYYTGEPVYSAKVQVGSYAATTNYDGFYQIFYPMSVDEERNKPIPFLVAAENYYDYDTEILLGPYSNEKNVEIYYAAPIIARHYGGWHLSSGGEIFLVLQAEIIDYQGIDTIDSVRSTFFITEGTKIVEIYRNMKLIAQTNEITALYQIYGSPQTFSPWELLEIFRIKVVDQDGYLDIASEQFAEVAPLFEPILP